MKENQINFTLRIPEPLQKELKIAAITRGTSLQAALLDAAQGWLQGGEDSSKTYAADPHEVTRTGPDQEAADALLAWWNSPEEDHVQAHLKRAIAAMLQIEHLLPGFLKGKKK
jgi:hypothetical protein